MDVSFGFLITDAARFGHEVDEHFVRNTDHRELRHISGIEFPDGTIRKSGQRLENLHLIVSRRIDQQVDVAGGAGITGLDDGKATHYDILGPQTIQLAAKPDHILTLRWTRNQLLGFVR
jgi:hypothetical protein